MGVLHLPEIAHPDFSIPRRKPTGAIGVDWGARINRGLIGAIFPGFPDLANGRKGNLEVNFSGFKGSSTGRHAYFPDTSTNAAINYGSRYLAQLGSRMTAIVLYIPDDTGLNPTFGKGLASTSQNNDCGFRLFSYINGGVDLARFRLFTSSATNLDLTWSAATGRQTALCYRYDGSTMSILQDGRQLGSTSASGAIDKVGSNTNLYLGTYMGAGNADTHARGMIPLFLLWDRALTDAEVRGVSLDPYRVIFRPIPPPLYFTTAGGGGITLTVASGLHAHAVDAPALTQAHNLAVAEAAHGHAADNLVLSQSTNLTPADALHDNSADSLALVQKSALTVAEAQHGQSVDNVALVQKSTLTVAETLHTHASDSPALTQANVLVVADAQHAQSADNVVLAAGDVLAVQAALHAHTADNVALTQKNILTVQEALHSVGSDNLALSSAASLTVFDSTHGHTVDSVALTQAHLLAVNDALHALSSDNLGLLLDVTLIVDDALHAHIADNVGLINGDVTTPGHRTFVIPRERRVFVIPLENRVYIVKGD